jgi:hypothetical protein
LRGLLSVAEAKRRLISQTVMTLDELIIQTKSGQNQQQSIKNLVMAINFYSFAG